MTDCKFIKRVVPGVPMFYRVNDMCEVGFGRPMTEEEARSAIINHYSRRDRMDRLTSLKLLFENTGTQCVSDLDKESAVIRRLAAACSMIDRAPVETVDKTTAVPAGHSEVIFKTVARLLLCDAPSYPQLADELQRIFVVSKDVLPVSADQCAVVDRDDIYDKIEAIGKQYSDQIADTTIDKLVTSLKRGVSDEETKDSSKHSA